MSELSDRVVGGDSRGRISMESDDQGVVGMAGRGGAEIAAQGRGERCRVVSEFGRCHRERGHRSTPDDRGHEINFDGTIVFRWTATAAGWALPTGGDWLYPGRNRRDV